MVIIMINHDTTVFCYVYFYFYWYLLLINNSRKRIPLHRPLTISPQNALVLFQMVHLQDRMTNMIYLLHIDLVRNLHSPHLCLNVKLNHRRRQQLRYHPVLQYKLNPVLPVLHPHLSLVLTGLRLLSRVMHVILTLWRRYPSVPLFLL